MSNTGSDHASRPDGASRPDACGRADPDHTHLASNGKAELTLDELAAIQPGMARLMVEIADRMWKCYHAGQARNRPLARYQLSEATKIMKASVVVRPKYGAAIGAYVAEEIATLRAVVEAEDWARFEEAFAEVVKGANRYHEQFDKGFLVWRVPQDPPRDLDLTPRP
ncbi:MAG: hypothetical protein ACYCST_02855 [Acidimicrobiales bacterium]